MPQTTEQRVAVLEEKLRQYDQEFKDNGTEGLIHRFFKLEENVKGMNSDLKKIAVSMSALAQSHVEQDAIAADREDNKKQRNQALQRVGTVFAIAFGIIGVLKLVFDYIS